MPAAFLFPQCPCRGRLFVCCCGRCSCVHLRGETVSSYFSMACYSIDVNNVSMFTPWFWFLNTWVISASGYIDCAFKCWSFMPQDDRCFQNVAIMLCCHCWMFSWIDAMPVSLWLTSSCSRHGPKCHPCHCLSLCELKWNCCKNYLILPV